MGTGIVFVVLVAIWVAYFVQYWSRRREHLATARSVEDFAEAMRVLERRPALRTASPGRISSAYAMSPARAVSARPAPRPQVVAKPHPTMPPPSRGGSTRMPAPTSSRPSPRPAHRMSPSRKVRGLTLLAALLGTLVTAILAPLTTLLGWVPLIGVAAVVASFLWLRAGVQAEIAARRAARGRRPRRRSRRPVVASEPRRPQSRRVEDRAPRSAPVPAPDPELLETSEVTATETADPDGWEPVPVPPPTYTLKARAERPGQAAPAEAVEPGESDAPVAVVAPTTDFEHATDVDLATASGEAQVEQRAAYGT